MASPMIILSIFLAVVVVGCVAGVAWLTRREEKEIPRPGSDAQFGQWLGDGDREGGPANPGGGGHG